MFGRILTAGLIVFLLLAGTVFFMGPWLHPGADEELPPCPYLQTSDFADLPPEIVASVGAYEAIRETLARESLDEVPAQSQVIARSFRERDAKIASVAKRIAGEQDVESARRAFMRLHRLMERDARKPPVD